MEKFLQGHRTQDKRWLQSRVTYLGFDVSEHRVHLTRKAVDVIAECPDPKLGAELSKNVKKHFLLLYRLQ